MSSGASGGVFINYRSEDSRSYGALLHAELARYLGHSSVFLDSESIPAGSDFVIALLDRVRRSRVLLAVIGPRWLADTGPDGRRRIDHEEDWIRRELVEAFAADITVIPVLIDEAEMPTAAQLPTDIAALARRQYRRLRHREASVDVARIVKDVITADPELAAAARRRPGGPRASRMRLGWMLAAGIATLGVIVGAMVFRPVHGTPGPTDSSATAHPAGPPPGCPPDGHPPPGWPPPPGYPPPPGWPPPPGYPPPSYPPSGSPSPGDSATGSPPSTAPTPSPRHSGLELATASGDLSGAPGHSLPAATRRSRTNPGSRLG